MTIKKKQLNCDSRYIDMWSIHWIVVDPGQLGLGPSWQPQILIVLDPVRV